MSVPTLQELRALAEPHAPGHHVSIYMPIHRGAREARQDQIRLKNLLRQAHEELLRQGTRSSEARELLAPAVRTAEDAVLWSQEGDGLALFAAPGRMSYYLLPVPVEEALMVGQRFYVVPLLPLVTDNGRFYVLALSQQRVRLVECTRWSAREVDLSATRVPASIEEALRYDEPEKQHQFRPDVSAPRAGGRWAAVFHGHGVVDEVKDDLRRYFLQIDRGLKAVLAEDSAPLVLAGVEYLFPLYRETNSYPRLADRGVSGNPDGLRPDELRARAWPVVDPDFRRLREQDVARYRQLLGTGLASADPAEVARGALQGRVEALFLDPRRQVWGRVDSSRADVQVHDRRQEGDEELVNFAALHALAGGGRIHATSPDDVALAAIFRY